MITIYKMDIEGLCINVEFKLHQLQGLQLLYDIVNSFVQSKFCIEIHFSIPDDVEYVIDKMYNMTFELIDNKIK